jgi:predicted O-methyltransferase YrrM
VGNGESGMQRHQNSHHFSGDLQCCGVIRYGLKMSESLKLYRDEDKHEEDKKELFQQLGSTTQDNNGQKVGISCVAFPKHDSVIGENSEIEIVTRMHLNGRTLDYMWPNTFDGYASTWGVDEEFAACLTGMVLALKPKVLLETGTNKGRSTRALIEGLSQNDSNGEKGIIYTVDLIDNNVKSSAAIPVDQRWRVNCLIGKCPDVFVSPVLEDLRDIDFAFLDGGHTQSVFEQELEYVDAHRAKECTVVVHNARDEAWSEVEEFFKSYIKYPHISLPVHTGAEIIQMR